MGYSEWRLLVKNISLGLGPISGLDSQINVSLSEINWQYFRWLQPNDKFGSLHVGTKKGKSFIHWIFSNYYPWFLRLWDISQFNMCMWKISKVTNAIFCKRLEYTLELFNFEGKPARLGGAGKFCSIAGEEVDGEGRKSRAERVNTTNIGRRVVILYSLNNLHSRFELSQVIYYMYRIYICFCPRSLCFKKGKVSALQKEAKAASSEICSLSPCRPNCLLHLGMSPKIPFLMY